MGENLNLVEILKDCLSGTKLYSAVHGDVYFREIRKHPRYPIIVTLKDMLDIQSFTSDGKILINYEGECVLFPSKDQRDWSKFKTKQSKFDPKTLKPFDKVLARDSDGGLWVASFFSHIRGNENSVYKYANVGSVFEYCIPYNEDTKHLAGTNDDAPEFYRFWED